MFYVQAFYNDDGFALPLDDASIPTLAGALREGFRLIDRVPCAECCIRRNSPGFVAYLETDWRGELKEAELYTGRFVTPLNPAGPLFRR
jgi:hypothetical protein